MRRELARVRQLRRVESARLAWAKDQRGCPWDPRTFTCIARVGTWRSRGGRRNEDARGTSGLAPMPREAATWRCCSGCGRTALRGRVDLRLCRAWRPPGGASVGARERRSVGRETCAEAARRPPGGAAVGASERRSVGRGTCAYAASGGHLEVLQWARANGAPWDEGLATDAAYAATWRCCSGRERTALRGTSDLRRCRAMAATWRCCSGRARTALRGFRGSAKPKGGGTRMWCGG